MIKFIAKLPKSYYKYADIDLNSLDKKDEDAENITLNLTSFISCKLEQYALLQAIPTQDILKEILITEEVLNKDEITLSGRSKSSSKFFATSCDDFKGIGTTKLYRVYMSKFAKAKVIKRMIEEGCDLSFFIKKSLVKKVGKKDYEMIKLSEIEM